MVSSKLTTKGIESVDVDAAESGKVLSGDESASPPTTPSPVSDKNAVADNSASLRTFKLTLLAAIVIQNTATVLLTRYTRSGVAPRDMYNISHMVFMCEIGKFLLACVFEQVSTGGKLVSNLERYVVQRPLDAAKIAIPALLYVVQNNVLYIALSNLTAPIFQVTYQGKLVTTAVVSVIMLKRSYSIQQWICLVGISLGVAVVVLGEKKGEEGNVHPKNTNLVVGLVSVLIACLSSAFAGVYFEKVVKKPQASDNSGDDAQKDPGPTVWMRNIQLAFFSLIFAYFQGGMEDTAQQHFFHGFGFWEWTLVVFQAGNGMLVAAIIKYTDNVLKGLAVGVSVVLSSALSLVLFSTPLGFQFVVGGTLIMISVWFFSNPFPTCTRDQDSK